MFNVSITKNWWTNSISMIVIIIDFGGLNPFYSSPRRPIFKSKASKGRALFKNSDEFLKNEQFVCKMLSRFFSKNVDYIPLFAKYGIKCLYEVSCTGLLTQVSARILARVLLILFNVVHRCIIY